MKRTFKELIQKGKETYLKVLAWTTGVYIVLTTPLTALAVDVGDSVLATGTKKLVEDLTKWLMILAPTVTVLLVVYYLIRKSASDEMDSKKWNSRITVALVSCIGAVLASVIVNLLVGYYQ